MAKSMLRERWVSSSLCLQVGNFDIWAKQKISFVFKMKLDKFLMKLKVKDWENFCQILWTFVQVLDKICPTLPNFAQLCPTLPIFAQLCPTFCPIFCPTFVHFSWHDQKLTKFSLYSTSFPSHFSNIYHKILDSALFIFWSGAMPVQSLRTLSFLPC